MTVAGDVGVTQRSTRAEVRAVRSVVTSHTGAAVGRRLPETLHKILGTVTKAISLPAAGAVARAHVAGHSGALPRALRAVPSFRAGLAQRTAVVTPVNIGIANTSGVVQTGALS